MLPKTYKISPNLVTLCPTGQSADAKNTKGDFIDMMKKNK